MKDPNWEEIKGPKYGSWAFARIHRARVPHGWLVTTGFNQTVTTVFVRDENHEWLG